MIVKNIFFSLNYLMYTNSKLKFIIFIVLFQNIGFAKLKPVSGYIFAENLEPLQKVKLVSLPSKVTTYTNKEGLFSVEIPVRDRKIVITKSGYSIDTLNVIFFKNNSTIFLKEVVIEDPLDNINQYISFVVSRRDNNIFHYPIEDFFLGGYVNIESIISANNLITLKIGLDGQKNISYREFMHNDMDLLYDGIKLNSVKNSLNNLTPISSLAMSDMVITKGGHYKLTATGGAINFIPTIAYNNKFSLNIQQGNNNPSTAVNGYGSLGYKSGVINGSLDTKQFAIAYSDTNVSEVFTNVDKNSFNIAYTNRKNLDVRLMSFNNIKNYSNLRTNSSLSDTLKNRIIKLSQWSPLTGLVALYGISQVNNEFSNLGNDVISKVYKSLGGGMSLEKDFQNSLYTFSTMTNIVNADYYFNADSIFLERQNSIFSGSAKYFFPSNKRKFNIKSFSVVYSKERSTDIPNTISSLNMISNYWDNTSFQLRTTVKIKRYPKLSLFYINAGNVTRTPNINEIISNRVSAHNYKIGLAPEKKSIYEFGFTFSDKIDSKSQKFKVDFSCFSHNYTNRIKKIVISGTSSDYSVNYGNINLYGFNNKIIYYPKWNWTYFETTLSSYSTPNFSYFPNHPAVMLSYNTAINTKYFDMIIKMRSEGKKYITVKSIYGGIETFELEQANYLNLIIYKNLNYRIFNLSISFSAENLLFKKLIIDNLNLFNNHYSANINLTII